MVVFFPSPIKKKTLNLKKELKNNLSKTSISVHTKQFSSRKKGFVICLQKKMCHKLKLILFCFWCFFRKKMQFYNVNPGPSHFEQCSLACARLLANLHFAFRQSKATLPFIVLLIKQSKKIHINIFSKIWSKKNVALNLAKHFFNK